MPFHSLIQLPPWIITIIQHLYSALSAVKDTENRENVFYLTDTHTRLTYLLTK